MSKVAYLLGAGASFGERVVDEKGAKRFIRGLPILSELKEAVNQLVPKNMLYKIDDSVETARHLGVKDVHQYSHLVRALERLREMCAAYPTIDTLARQLYLTKQPYITADGNSIYYNDLKSILSIALLMMQSHEMRDLRYDGFIASIINDKRQMPPMTILSWNYDAQFELAYSGYSTESRYIPRLWKELNVLNKTYPTEYDSTKPFAMIKLNGTAFFTDITSPVSIQGREVGGIRDCFFGERWQNPYQYGAEYINSRHYTTLSYSWEKEENVVLKNQVMQRIHDTELLIVIGYSFPYVNSDLDTFIIENMPRLQRIIIQDMNYTDVKERIEEMIPASKRIPVAFEHKTNLQQFYIPNSFK